MKKKMNKVLVVCTAAAAMTAFSGTAFGATLDLESKTAVADAKDGAGDVYKRQGTVGSKCMHLLPWL